ncbi:MAG: HAMP domain-containing histidine kinase [Clostridia bacterium]|nr:HAMP domain-containing histidine kinase [Clostridia bacterium]
MDNTDRNKLTELLALLDVPAFFVKNGSILCRNAAAEPLLCEDAVNETIAALDAGQDHVFSTELAGRMRTLSCKTFGGGLLCQIAPEQTPSVSADYLDIISGELRKPLGELMMALEKLYPSLPKSEQTTYNAGQAQRNIHRLLRLASQLNAGSRIKKGTWQLSCEKTDLCEWLDRLAMQAEDLFSYTSIRFCYSGLTAPFVGDADLEKLERAIWNLLSNSLLHAPEGSTVSLEARRSRAQLILSVSDEADGVQGSHGSVFSHDTERIGLEDAKDGLGFGLSIVRACAELHGGSVLLTSKKEGGTTAVLSVPVSGQETQAHSVIPVFDYSGGIHHGLLELSDALDPAAFCPQEL